MGFPLSPGEFTFLETEPRRLLSEWPSPRTCAAACCPTQAAANIVSTDLSGRISTGKTLQLLSDILNKLIVVSCLCGPLQSQWVSVVSRDEKGDSENQFIRLLGIVISQNKNSLKTGGKVEEMGP